MNIDDDEYCTADIGVFGNLSCGCSSCNPRYERHDPKRQAEASRQRKLHDQSVKASRDFNLYVIDLYNEARRRS